MGHSIARSDVGVGGICGEVSAKGVSVAIVVVGWVHQLSLGADSDAVLIFIGSLVIQLRRGDVTAGRYCGP